MKDKDTRDSSLRDEFDDNPLEFQDCDAVDNWPADSLTDDERKQIAEDFKKDDLHLIIGNHINGDEEYKRCIDWPKASKEDMLSMELGLLKRMHGLEIHSLADVPAGDEMLFNTLKDLGLK